MLLSECLCASETRLLGACKQGDDLGVLKADVVIGKEPDNSGAAKAARKVVVRAGRHDLFVKHEVKTYKEGSKAYGDDKHYKGIALCGSLCDIALCESYHGCYKEEGKTDGGAAQHKEQKELAALVGVSPLIGAVHMTRNDNPSLCLALCLSDRHKVVGGCGLVKSVRKLAVEKELAKENRCRGYKKHECEYRHACKENNKTENQKNGYNLKPAHKSLGANLKRLYGHGVGNLFKVALHKLLSLQLLLAARGSGADFGADFLNAPDYVVGVFP